MTARCALLCAAVLLAGTLAPAHFARAHPMRFGLLTLTETTPGRFRVHFRYSGSEAAPDRSDAVLPAQCVVVGAGRRVVPITSGFDAKWAVDCGEQGLRGLVGAEGLADASAQVLLKVSYHDGRSLERLLDANTPVVDVGGPPEASRAAARETRQRVLHTYVALGVEHIALGFDHLLFVLGLMLLVPRWRPLLATITSFTVGHSITLALATLGWLAIPVRAVEACIALSILLLAVELAHPERPASLTRTWPWVVAGAFGLLHGLGFAGALAEVGLPEEDIPTALFAFNVGVELGQLAFVLAVASVRRLARRVRLPHPPRWLAPYTIGALSAYWVIDRVAAFWS